MSKKEVSAKITTDRRELKKKYVVPTPYNLGLPLGRNMMVYLNSNALVRRRYEPMSTEQSLLNVPVDMMMRRGRHATVRRRR